MRPFRQLALVAALLLQSLSALADDVITNVMSPVVSFQYPDDFSSQALTNGGVLSPIASYQYFEWPGYGVLQLQSSPWVSYFYQIGSTGNVTMHGRVLDAQGSPVSGASVEISVMGNWAAPAASATSGVDGYYSLPGVGSGVYAARASKSAQVSETRVATLNTATAQQDFQLHSLPPAPPTVTASDSPLNADTSIEGSVLRVFDGTTFVTNLALLNTNKMTVVLTHGWIPGIGDTPATNTQGVAGWPLSFALAMRGPAGLSAGMANIVAWDWQTAARSALPPESKSPRQGIALGVALQNALGTGYQQKVHFIGHSLGTLVNGYTVDYLHGHQRAGHAVAAHRWQTNRTHVTMFDEAAISRLISKQTLFKLFWSGPKSYAASVVLGWQNPVPHDFLWMDNYISSVGRYHPEGVNVLLQKGMLFGLANEDWWLAPVTAHGYPLTWYQRTVTNQYPTILGFGQTFESASLHSGTDFPPPNSPGPGIAYRQSEASGDEMALEIVADLEPRLFYPAVSVIADAGLETFSGWAEDVLVYVPAPVRTTGAAVVNVVENGMIEVGNATIWVVGQAGDLRDSAMDLLNQAGLQLHLQTQPGTSPAPQLFGFNEPAEGPSPGNSPPCIWLPIVIPTNASGIVFQFVVNGNGAQDSFVFGINGTNLLSLETQFLAVGQTNISPLIDVSAWAGTTNELFFGILGGTSTDCSVQIDSIRFIAAETPRIELSQLGSASALSWPSTAFGYALETTTNIGSGWVEVSNAPSLFGGRYTTTNTWTGETRFFRLRQR